MRDDFHEYSNDPNSQKSVTDWLMQVIARKQDAVLHEEAKHEKVRAEADGPKAVVVADAPNSHAPIPMNGSNGSSPSQNGYGHDAAAQNGNVVPIASQNGHAPSQVIDVFGDVFAAPPTNGHVEPAPAEPEQAAPSEIVFSLTADDLCGPPAFGPVPVVSRLEVTADDLCWIPKPQVTETSRNGNGHYDFGTASAEPVAEVQLAPEPVAIPEPEIIPHAPLVEAQPSEQVAQNLEPLYTAPEIFEPFEPLRAPDILSEQPSTEAQMSAAGEIVPATEAPAAEEPAMSPAQWHEQMIASAKASPEPKVIEAQPSTAAEVLPAVEPLVIAPAAPEIAASVESSGPVIEAGAEPAAAPEVLAPASGAVPDAQAQVADQASGTPAAGGEQGTNLVKVERRKRKRPSVSIADICRDWVIDEMEANGGVPEPQEMEEEEDFLAEDSIVQTPESVFAHEGIWGNTAAGADGGQLPNIPEIESGAAAQAQAKKANSSGMKALLRLGTLLPWLAREMEAGNDQNAALTQEVRHEVSGMRLVQYEIRSTVHDHSLQLKRVEEQLTRVRESIAEEQSGTAELVESVKSTTKVVSMVGVGLCAMLVAILGLVMFMVLHGR